MATDLLLMFLGFAVGCVVGYKMASTGGGSIMPQKGFLRPKSWDEPQKKESKFQVETYDRDPFNSPGKPPI